MAILLKKLINEAVTIGIDGYDYDREILTMGDLAKKLNTQVGEKIVAKHPEAYFQLKHSPIHSAGSSFNDQEGDIYVYTGYFPEELRPKLLGGVAYVLNTLNAKTGKWKTKGRGYGQMVIIPVLRAEFTHIPAPSVIMGGGSLEVIKDILDLDDESYELPDNSLSLTVGTNELYKRILYYSNPNTKTTNAQKYEGNQTIRGYIKLLADLVQWALDNGYKKITTIEKKH